MYIKTNRLTLQSIASANLDQLVELLTDETVKKTYMIPDFPDREAAMKLARRIQQLSQDPDRYVVGMYLGDQLIGMMNDTDRTENAIEMGYAVLPRFQNQGYCTEALTGVIAYLLDCGFPQVLTGAFEENIASQRVMEKSGMTKIDKVDEIEYRGKNHRCIYFVAKKG